MDLLIVADPRDLLAALVASEARRAGLKPIVLDHARAARLFTISGGGAGISVEPDLPMLLRPRTALRADASADERFLKGECEAALWAAAALAASPVVNRPGCHGFEGRWTGSGATLERRAGLEGRTEIYGRPSAALRPPDARPWAAESGFGRASRWRKARPAGRAFRARPMLPGERYEAIVVLGGDAWRTSDVELAVPGLRDRSSQAVRRLGLTFAVAIWGLSGSLDEARLARIDPYPRPDQLAPVWPEVGPALLKALGC